MSYQISHFNGQSKRLIRAFIPKIGRAAVKTKLAAISTALNSDTRTHDVTEETAPAALSLNISSSGVQDDFTNAMNELCNKCIGANITQATIKTNNDALTSTYIASLIPSCCRNPEATATSLSVGGSGVASVVDGGDWNWSDASTVAYQWTRDGSNISLATSSTYTFVSGDISHTVACVVTVTNGDGSGSASTNGFAVVA